MTDPVRRVPLAVLAATAVAALAACSVPASQSPGPAASTAGTASPAASPSSSTAAPSPVTPSIAAADKAASADSTTTLVVPAGQGGRALSTPRQLTVPAGWTARVWARVDDARMEAWTPEGDLLVSSAGDGSIMELRPDRGGHRDRDHPGLGLTNPQGMAFAKLDDQWVLYVAESDQIDRYPWGPRGSAAPAR